MLEVRAGTLTDGDFAWEVRDRETDRVIAILSIPPQLDTPEMREIFKDKADEIAENYLKYMK